MFTCPPSTLDARVLQVLDAAPAALPAEILAEVFPELLPAVVGALERLQAEGLARDRYRRIWLTADGETVAVQQRARP